MTQINTNGGGPQIEPISFKIDPGTVPVELLGKTFSVSPAEELHRIGLMLDADKGSVPDNHEGERAMLVIRDYIKQKHGVDVSPDLATSYYNKLKEADRKIADFFGLTLKLPSTSEDLTREPPPMESDGRTDPALTGSMQASHSEGLANETPAKNSEQA